MHRTIIRTSAALAAILFALVWGTPQTAAAQEVDLTGTWTFNVQTDQGGGAPTVTLEQDGQNLTGHYSSATLGEADVTGTVEGNRFTLSMIVDLQGQQAPVTYDGEVQAPDSVSGSFDLGGMLGGTFTGTRQEQ